MRRPNNTSKSFLDLLFNVLMGFFMLLMIAIVLINPESKNKDIELRAELLITMEWSKDSKSDLDLMVKTPSGDIVYYGRNDIKTASLDRDDRGTLTDKIRMEDGTIVVIKENWENVVIRKLVPGEYIVNVYAFSNRDRAPLDVNIEVQRLNPRHRTVFKGKQTLYMTGDEATFVRFTIDSAGRITSIDDTPESFRLQLKGGMP